MLGIFKKTLEKNTLSAICPEASGIAVARVKREKDIPPVLELCDYQSLDEGELLRDRLTKLSKTHQLDRSLCTSTIQLDDYSLLLVEAPEVPQEELRDAVRWRVKDLIDYQIDDAVIDVFEVPKQRAGGQNKMMFTVVARSAQIKQLIDDLLEADLNLEIVDIPELALRNIAALLPEDVGGTVLVYVGQESGLITITRQGTLYLSRRFDQGLSSIPDTAMHADDETVIHDWLDTIVIEIQRSLDYYESHFSQPRVSGLVITPTDRELAGATDYLTEQVGIPSRQLDINQLIDVAEPVDSTRQFNCLLAIGAALRQEAVMQ